MPSLCAGLGRRVLERLRGVRVPNAVFHSGHALPQRAPNLDDQMRSVMDTFFSMRGISPVGSPALFIPRKCSGSIVLESQSDLLNGPNDARLGPSRLAQSHGAIKSVPDAASEVPTKRAPDREGDHGKRLRVLSDGRSARKAT